MKLNPPSLTDFYKKGHREQYPEGTKLVYSNATCRGDKHFKGLPDFDHKVVNFGLQGICQWLLIDYWNENFFNKPKGVAVKRHARTVSKALGIEYNAEELNALHDLGYLPIVIKSLPEGSRVDIKVPTYTIRNTKPEFFWLTNYLETQIQAESWKCKVSATTAYEFRRLFERYAKKTGVDKAFVDFQGHDFSMRGMSGVFDATQCGAGHLLSFKGTDTIPSIEYLENYYMGNGAYIFEDSPEETMKQIDDRLGELYNMGVRKIMCFEEDGSAQFFDVVKDENSHTYSYNYNLEDAEDPNILIGASVPATEHAVMAMSGKDNEIGLFERLICKVYPNGFVSIVSDTWDFWQVITDYTVRLKDKIMARDGKVVFRPDSGDPVDIICGTAIPITKKMLEDQDWEYFDITAALVYAEDNKLDIFSYDGKFYEYRARGFGNPYVEVQPTPEMKGAVECLWDVFGGTERIVESTDGDSIEQNTYKTLDSHVGLIYGDSINLDRAQQILKQLADKGFSSANIVFGIGSFTYQFVTRDTFSEAVKATFGIVNGEPREIFKNPKTGDGGKKSAKGLIRVEKEGNNYVLYDQQTWEQETQGELKELFRDGRMMRLESHHTIRERLLNE